jgi:peptidoglycan/LPS O-acetylase OafA/YrhL
MVTMYDYESLQGGGTKEGLAAKAGNVVRWTADLLQPAIMNRAGARRQQIRRTAYLDGLRGFAALLVYFQHHQLWPLRSVPTGRILETAYGFENRFYFAALPGVRTFFTGGHFAVAVFFVISGYVLSLKPLTLIHGKEFTKLGDNLGSALFRRWIRLFLPIILVTFIYITVFWHMLGLWTESPVHERTWRGEIWKWYIEFKNFSFVFRSGGDLWFTYNFPTWSIPFEFRGSIVVYTCLMAFSRSTKNARLLCSMGLMAYFMYVADGWFCFLFVYGMILCELDLLAMSDELPSIISRFKNWRKPLAYLALIIAIILGGCPSHVGQIEYLQKGWGWYYLSFLKPQAVYDQKWFYLSYAAVLLVPAIPLIPWLRRFFESSFNQYLGRISFSLYLVHGPVLWTLGDRLYCAVGWYKEAHEKNIPEWLNTLPLSKNGPLGLEPAFLVPQMILLPFTLWVAEIATKLCDEPSVKLAQWMYRWTLVAPPPPPSHQMELQGKENNGVPILGLD